MQTPIARFLDRLRELCCHIQVTFSKGPGKRRLSHKYYALVTESPSPSCGSPHRAVRWALRRLPRLLLPLLLLPRFERVF